MIIREAKVRDVKDLHTIRMAVKENVLNDPSKVKDSDYHKYLTHAGKGWLCELEGEIVGFGIIDLSSLNVWALFISPEYQGQGIGKMLHDRMLGWYFNRFSHELWLTTAAGTKAETFYRKAGWREVEKLPNGEIKFVLQREDWNSTTV